MNSDKLLNIINELFVKKETNSINKIELYSNNIALVSIELSLIYNHKNNSYNIQISLIDMEDKKSLCDYKSNKNINSIIELTNFDLDELIVAYGNCLDIITDIINGDI